MKGKTCGIMKSLFYFLTKIIMTSLNYNFPDLLIHIYCFVDDILTTILNSIKFALKSPDNHNPPSKKYNLKIAELITLGIIIIA